MKIYISVPISGLDIETQRALSRSIADKVSKVGHTPVNPFDAPEPPMCFTEAEKYGHYMGEDMKMLLACDGIVFAPGWKNSKGCRLENAAAVLYDKKRYFSTDDIEPNGIQH